MAERTEKIIPGEIYHIYNRGVAKTNVFQDDNDRQRFLDLLLYYLPDTHRLSYSLFVRNAPKEDLLITKRGEGLVDLLCYCLMDNHIHLLLHENTDSGVRIYLQRIFTSYAKYFNIRHHRVGPLFSGRFKAVRIIGNEQFLQVNRYIHLNPFAAGMVNDPLYYKWSSVTQLVHPNSKHCHTELLHEIISPTEYKGFLKDYAAYVHEQDVIVETKID